MAAYCNTWKFAPLKAWRMSVCPLHTTPSLNRQRFDTRHPYKRPDTHRRRTILDLTLPTLPYKERKLDEMCRHKHDMDRRNNNLTTLSEYEEFLVPHIFNWIERSRIFLIAHQLDWTERERQKVLHNLYRAGLEYKKFNNRVMRVTLASTKYEVLTNLFQGRTVFILESPRYEGEEMRLKRLLSSLHNLPLIIMGGVIDDVVMSAEQIKLYSTLGEKMSCQTQLCSTLGQSSLHLTQSTLVRSQCDLGQILGHISGESM